MPSGSVSTERKFDSCIGAINFLCDGLQWEVADADPVRAEQRRQEEKNAADVLAAAYEDQTKKGQEAKDAAAASARAEEERIQAREAQDAAADALKSAEREAEIAAAAAAKAAAEADRLRKLADEKIAATNSAVEEYEKTRKESDEKSKAFDAATAEVGQMQKEADEKALNALWKVENAQGLETKAEGMRYTFLEVNGVREAVTALNSRAIDCPFGVAMVYSSRQEQYFLLWRHDKAEFVAQFVDDVAT